MTTPIITGPTERQRLQEQIGAIQPVWDQKPKEPPQWYRRFHAYLTMDGTRSVLKVANAERENAKEPPHTELPGHWSDASRDWQWVSRARQYDRWRALRDRLEVEEERVAAGIRRRATIATAEAGLAAEIVRLTRKGQKGQALDGRLRKTRVVDLIASYKTIADLERREYGESDAPVRIQHSGIVDGDPNPVGEDVISIDPNLLLPDELDDLIPLLERINARVAAARTAAESDPDGALAGSG